MRIKQILLNLVMLTMLIFMVGNVNAQVCIGSLEQPETGALLQLKSIDNVNDGSSNAFGGLGMPKVALTSITNLYPMFPDVYEKDVHDIPHTGLVVYNVNENLFNGDGAGLYVWDGAKWTGIGLPTRRIFANPTSVYLSEIMPKYDVELTTIPENLAWTMTTDHDISSSSCGSKDHKNNLLFQRNETAVYGNRTYTFTIDNSDKYVDVNVAHIGLTLNKTLFKVGENGTVSSSSVVLAEGGDANWFVKSYTKEKFNWTIPPHNADGSLSFTLGNATQSGIVEGTITVAHVNDHNLTKEITVQQNKDYVVLPKFDYLVIQYVYAMDILPPNVDRVDLDTGTEFSETGVSTVDNRPVGWNLGSTISTNSKSFLYWPGDNVKTGYESVYANMTILRDNILPANAKREFNVDMYCTWFYPTAAQMGNNNKITINITLYRGGTMKVHNTYDYINDGGEEVFNLNRTNLPVTTYQGVKYFRTNYSNMLRLEYDRIDNTGVLTPLISTRMAPQMEDMPDMLPNETKSEYSNRVNEYRKQVESSVEE